MPRLHLRYALLCYVIQRGCLRACKGDRAKGRSIIRLTVESLQAEGEKVKDVCRRFLGVRRWCQALLFSTWQLHLQALILTQGPACATASLRHR